jgi:hypothetical protein
MQYGQAAVGDVETWALTSELPQGFAPVAQTAKDPAVQPKWVP